MTQQSRIKTFALPIWKVLALFFLWSMTACGDDPVDLTPTDTMKVDQGTASPEPDMMNEPVDDMGVMEMLYPDEEAFINDILPILTSQCGASCHLNSVVLGNNNSPGGNDYEFDPDDVENSISEILHPAYANLADPENSEVLLHHGGNYFATLEQKRAVRDWLADVLIPKGGTVSPTGPSGLTCNHLPTGDGIGPDGWFAEFETSINPMFVGTAEEPQGYCSGGACHTTADVGGDFDLLPVTDPCSARWNFMVSQAFINVGNLTASSLLRQPLGEPSQDPNISIHGGQEVFKGQDANYTLLRQWITRVSEVL